MAFLPKMTVFVSGLLIGLFGLSGVVQSTPNTNISIVLCNSGVYSEGDPFATSLAYVIADLKGVTSSRPGYDYHNISPYPNAFAYGHAACNNNLTSLDCSTCLGAAENAMFGTCDSRIGARSVLIDCTIRYEEYPFDD
ncbi:antifungal protein ginkbilobin-like protein [Actinidia eriantha]|uniref:antifungal protein ginkbilobin-like protein n=1 Tax=Actinidia eriantha TaxID=165200 RepID=UPI002584968C|nr:antifungal protein ginkbilobin-like protein [Actinidia eriantha]